MPVDEPANETPVVATSAMLVEPVNETPVEQANEAPVAPNNEMSMTVPPHLLAMTSSTSNLTVQINNYEPFPLKAFVKFNGNEIEIDQSNEGCFPQGPPFFKWAIENLLPADMIKSIHDEAPLEAAKLKTLVRGIRPRVDAKAKPRPGEPTDFVLLLGEFIQANDPRSQSRGAFRAARQMFDKGKLCKYTSACLCNIVHDGNGSVSLY